jgi:hypothetical protein
MAPGIRTVRDEMYETHTRFEDIVDLARREGRDLTAEEDQEAAALTRRMKFPSEQITAVARCRVRSHGGVHPRGGRRGRGGGDLGDGVRAKRGVQGCPGAAADVRPAAVDRPARDQGGGAAPPAGGWPPSTLTPPAPPPAAPYGTLRVSDLFRRGQAEGGNVSFIRDPGQPATDAPVAPTTLKPELTLTAPLVTLPIEAIAVWTAPVTLRSERPSALKVSDQALEDAAQIRTWIDSVLAADLLDANNGHADFFTRNLTALTAEARVALVIWRPAAYGIVTGLGR